MAEKITPSNAAAWRAWLKKHHAKQTEVWVVYVKTAHGRSMTWSDAVDEALCFGWIDTTAKAIDDKHYMQRFTRRRPGSKWSVINKAKVAKLIADGRMTKTGLAEVELAKQNGQWDKAETWRLDVEMPPELEAALTKAARATYAALAPGYQKLYRRYVAEAKQQATRDRRAKQCVVYLAAGEKNPFGGAQRPT